MSAKPPPPSMIDLSKLPDSTLLTAKEVAGILRVTTGTLEMWRLRQKNHPLKWLRIMRTPRYMVGDVKNYLASANNK